MVSGRLGDEEIFNTPERFCRQLFIAYAAFSFNNQWNNSVAAAAPRNCATIKGATEEGAMPAKVLDKLRAMVTAGLANDVEAVNQ